MATDRYAVLMFDTRTNDHQLYDVFIGADAHLAALDLAMNEATPTVRPIVLDVNALIAESDISAVDLAQIIQAQP